MKRTHPIPKPTQIQILSDNRMRDLSLQAARDKDVLKKYSSALNFIESITHLLPTDSQRKAKVFISVVLTTKNIIKDSEGFFITSPNRNKKNVLPTYKPKAFFDGIIEGDVGNIELQPFFDKENDIIWVFKEEPTRPAKKNKKNEVQDLIKIE